MRSDADSKLLGKDEENAKFDMSQARRHELLSIVLLGIGTLFLMTGYDTQSFIVESVLHSVNGREPTIIDGHAGYYGQAFLYAAYTLATLISPWLCYKLSSKWSLFAGSICFSVYLAGFFYLNSYFYYFSQILMGLGFALFYSGQGLYMAEHSSRATICRNSALISAIGNSGMCLGGIVLIIINGLYPAQEEPLPTTAAIDNSTIATSQHSYRMFTDIDIFIVFGAFLAATVLANIILALLPTRQYESIASCEKVEEPTVTKQLGLIIDAMREPRSLMLAFFFVHYGLQVSFMLSALPTTFSFTRQLSSHVNLPAYYSITIGLGNILMGIYINAFSRRYPSFGLIPTMLTQMFVSMLTYALIFLALPNKSTIMPNDDGSLWLHPTPAVVFIIGMLMGIADGCLTPMRVIICTLAIPSKKLQTYSIAKLYQSLASCVAFFLSPYITVHTWIQLLTVAQVLSTIAFIRVSLLIARDAKREKDSQLHVKVIDAKSLE